jgi:hypothetical protein
LHGGLYAGAASLAGSSGEENDKDSVPEFTRGFPCDTLRDRPGLSVVFGAHPPKGQNGLRGARDWEAVADSVIQRVEPFAMGSSLRFMTVTGEGPHPLLSTP